MEKDRPEISTKMGHIQTNTCKTLTAFSAHVESSGGAQHGGRPIRSTLGTPNVD